MVLSYQFPNSLTNQKTPLKRSLFFYLFKNTANNTYCPGVESGETFGPTGGVAGA
jgi:hypothetical protein